ncbi:TetR family transcriptional regulator [Vibrio sp. 10N.286.49.B3]|nr:TetR family transcriptional regulator [Vibrio sp. 10N.286.49.B3]
MAIKSEQKRAQILKAASELFCQFGYQVNMDQIAKHANVSKQTVYSHFQTKAMLFESHILSKCKEREVGTAALDDSQPINAVLYDFGLKFQAMHLETTVQQTFRNAVSQTSSHPELGQLYLKYGPERTLDLLADYLQRQDDLGRLTLASSAQNSAMQLLLMFHGKAVYWAFLGGESQENEAERALYIQQCVELFLLGNQ